MFTAHLYVFFGEMYIQICCPFLVVLFLFWVMRVLYISWILDPYQIMWFIKLFSHSVVCLFHFLAGVLESTKVSFWQSQFIFFFFLIACAFAVIAKKPLLNPKPQGFIFVSKIFTVLDLKFKSLIHFVWVSVDDVR